MRQSALAFLVAMLAASASAQSMVEVDMTGQPLSYNQNGDTSGCGIRIVGVLPSGSSSPSSVKSFDISANYWVNGIALVKMIGQVSPFDGAAVATPKRLKLFGGWLKADGKNPASPTGSGFSESPNDKAAYLFPVSPKSAIEFILAAAKGDTVQVGLAWEKNASWTYYGSVKLSDGDRTQINRCLQEILK